MMNNYYKHILDETLKDFFPGEFFEQPQKFCEKNAALLKSSGYNRAIWQLELNNRKFLVKQYTISGIFDFIKWKLKNTAPQKEINMLTHLCKHGVNIPTLLMFFYKAQNFKKEVWLIIEYIDNIVTFDQIEPEIAADTTIAAQNLAIELAKMHMCGLVHNDLHSGNLLFCRTQNKWTITDFQRAKLCHVNKKNLLRDLTQLQHCLGKKVPLKTRINFLKKYLSEISRLSDPDQPHDQRLWKSIWYELQNLVIDYTINQTQARQKRSYTNNRNFATLKKFIKEEIFNGYIKMGISKTLLTNCLSLFKNEQWKTCEEIQLLVNTLNYAQMLYVHPQGNIMIEYSKKAIAKKHNNNFLKLWNNAWRLECLHCQSMRAIFYAESSKEKLIGWLPTENVTMEYALTDTQTNKNKRKILIKNTAKGLAHWHNYGVSHNNINADTVMFSNYYEKPELYLKNTESIEFSEITSWNSRIKDLAGLYNHSRYFVNGIEQRLFLRIYLKHLVKKIDLKILMNDILVFSNFKKIQIN